jgi:hypothetical protein
MKPLIIAMMLAACTFSASAQNTPQQWTITATSESAPNALILLDASGNPFPCTGQNIDNINDPTAGCYDPLEVTTDWTLTELAGVVTSVTANTPDTLTNSSCSADSSVASTSISETNILGFLYQATFSVTMANGATITFKGNVTLGANQFTGTFTSTGACMGADSGNFTATLFPAVNAAYVGQFETSSGGQGVTINLATASNFSVTGTVTPAGNASTCFSTMTIGTPLANSFSASFASGDAIVAVASDSSGNVVGLIASNTDANGQVIASDGLYFTYLGLAGACSGIFETDAPFRKERPVSPRRRRIRTRDEIRELFERRVPESHPCVEPRDQLFSRSEVGCQK